MDWNLKIPSWDFAEFEQGTVPNIDSISGSNSYEGQGIKGSFSVDLKLGQVIDSRNELRESLNSKGSTNTSKMSLLSPSGSSKRARPVNLVHATAACLVDGCNADLSSCKEYHRRHKVCEVHSKTPQVSINGHKQRFCQQCSRFHSLEEFDEGKRSCRKRLDGHNRRRRKPQPDTLSRGTTFFPGHQGTTMLQFSNPHTYASNTSTMLTNHPWTGVVKAEDDVKYYTGHTSVPQDHNLFRESSSKAAGKQQFSFFHDSGTNLELNHHVSSSKAVTFASSELFCDGYQPPAHVVHSDCALSLLSSSSPSQTPPAAPPLVHQPGSFTTTASRGWSYGGWESIVVPNANDRDVGCNGMIHMEPRDHGAPDQTLPFYWE